jgi:lipopolysaccharide export system protein LptC
MKKRTVVLSMIFGLLLAWSAASSAAETTAGNAAEGVSSEPYTVENLRSIDANQDGVLDKNEIAADPRMHDYYGNKKMFQHADRNNDGVISVEEAKSQREWQMGQNKPAAKKEAREKVGDKKEDIRDSREDIRDRREDVRDRKEDVRDRRDDKKKAEQLSSLQGQLANTTDPQEQANLQQQIDKLQNNIRRDKQEDIRDRREDIRDRREDVRDRRENIRDRKDRPAQHRPQGRQGRARR